LATCIISVVAYLIKDMDVYRYMCRYCGHFILSTLSCLFAEQHASLYCVTEHRTACAVQCYTSCIRLQAHISLWKSILYLQTNHAIEHITYVHSVCRLDGLRVTVCSLRCVID